MGNGVIELTGKQFGELTVLSIGEKEVNTTHYKWICKCSCGKTVQIRGTSLRNGITKSCGCIRKGRPTKLIEPKRRGRPSKSPKPIKEKIRGRKEKYGDLVGKEFGRLTVVSFVGKNKHGSKQWECKCSCGKHTIVTVGALVRGMTRSCGCLRKEKVSTIGGLSKNHTYKSWHCMMYRCTNPKDRKYKYYGGRGVNVCQRWQESFLNFLEDMGERPDGRTLDRIDPEGNYEPGNCRWATIEVQQQNRRKKKKQHLHTQPYKNSQEVTK
jgi:hypothetical protein